MLHPTELCFTLSELQCTIRTTMHPLSLAAPFCYAVPYWATLDPNWAMLQPKNYNVPLPPCHRSFAVPSDENITKRKPRGSSSFGKNPWKCSTAHHITVMNIAVLLFLLVKILYRENPVEVPVLETIRESGVQLIILLYVLLPFCPTHRSFADRSGK